MTPQNFLTSSFFNIFVLVIYKLAQSFNTSFLVFGDPDISRLVKTKYQQKAFSLGSLQKTPVR